MTIPTRQDPSGIRFDDYIFSEPVSLSNWIPSGYPGVFTVLIFDPNWAPRPLRPLYFGEFGNNTPAQKLYQDCARVVSTVHEKHLFVSMLLMPFTTTPQRCAVRDELISAYHPACQNNIAPMSSDLAQKVNELERRHQEQNAQVMLLVAGVSRFFEQPQPPQPRRRIGFNPLSEDAS